MNTTQTRYTGVAPDVLADLESAARYAASGITDPDVVRKACERMDQMREELRRQGGTLRVAVGLVREVRDEA